MPPGRTAVALLVSHVSVADLQRELARFPQAELVETDLPDAAVAAVQHALVEANRAAVHRLTRGCPAGPRRGRTGPR